MAKEIRRESPFSKEMRRASSRRCEDLSDWRPDHLPVDSRPAIQWKLFRPSCLEWQDQNQHRSQSRRPATIHKQTRADEDHYWHIGVATWQFRHNHWPGY